MERRLLDLAATVASLLVVGTLSAIIGPTFGAPAFSKDPWYYVTAWSMGLAIAYALRRLGKRRR